MSYNHLKSNPSGSKLYTRWFGTFRHDLYAVVLERFSVSYISSYRKYIAQGPAKQRLREEPATWEYHCDCFGRDVLASTDSREPGLIKPCPAFWQAPATGIGSKAAVIIQEGTRWDYRSGTLNFARGEQKSLALAGANPFKAAYNSDSYAYFAIDAYKEKA
ncbi:unnamed protein product [Rhizoctonia solani]|uniref:Lysine-specific metallo-endopeptidase domain-containing protein n=1 Tax=Rhizoctonia solani TaxID=456999 RepID=A0A8H3DSI3_9AGAM|nr:unnamed protein product [Rhizoctonia solani]